MIVFFQLSNQLAAPWGAAAAAAGAWLVFPTLTNDFKANFGMADAPAPGTADASASVKYTKAGVGEPVTVKS